MAKVNTKQFGMDILNALGVDTKNVRGFRLNVSVNEPVTITLERWVDEPENQTAISDVFQKYKATRVLKQETFEVDNAQRPEAIPADQPQGTGEAATEPEHELPPLV